MRLKQFPYQVYNKLIVFIVLAFPMFVNGQAIHGLKVNGDFKAFKLENFIQKLENENQIKFFYKKSWIDSVSINQTFIDVPLEDALRKIFYNRKLTFKFFQKNTVIIFPLNSKDRFQETDLSGQLTIVGDPMNVGRYKIATLKGKIIDGKTGDFLPGAVVYSSKADRGTSSDINGNFTIELPTGEHNLQITFMGFEEANRKIKLIESGGIEFELFEETHSLEEVTVLGENTVTSKTQMSLVKVDSKELKKLPVLMGETDVIKGVTMMAGVQTVGELSSGFNVRGGNTDQNLILLDGSPVFNTSHLFGFLSMINPDVIENVNLYKGGLPARYGERISSVMDLELKDGNDKTIKAYGGIGLINSRLAVDGPLSKNKKLKIISGLRSSYTDWVLKKVPDENVSQSVTNFYDYSGKLTFNFDLHNQISMMGYVSNDEYSTSANSINKYGNLLLNLNVRNKLGEKLSSELDLSYSKYSFRLTDLADSVLVKAYYLKNQVQYSSAKYHFSWQPHARHNVHFGLNGIYYLNDPGEIVPYKSESIIASDILDREKALETAVYISDEFEITPEFTLNLGLRYSRFDLFGPGTVFFIR